MPNCPQCDRELDDETTVCPTCGENPSKTSRAGDVDLASVFGAEKKGRAPDSFTKADLVKGLKSAADGTPMDDFLPSTDWEQYTAALLEVLFKKHLVFPNEIDQGLTTGKKKKSP